jgi:DNA-directed RNA polymerase specialized sigma24 family protein
LLLPSFAHDGVQEVMIAAAKKMPEFSYEPGKDSLKGWLLAETRWKVADQFRKRQAVPPPNRSAGPPTAPREAGALFNGDATARTDTVERVPDPNGFVLEDVWEGEWRENLLRAALDQVKRRANPAHYEIYHLHVVQDCPPKQLAVRWE